MTSRPLENVSYAEIVAARAGAKSRDIACPICGPQHKGVSAKRKVLRTWTLGGDRISLHCARCGLEGWIAPEGGSIKNGDAPKNDVTISDDDERKRQRNAELAEKTWRESVPIGAAAESYFLKRGISISHVPGYAGLRFHPLCSWGDLLIACIIGRFTDAVTGEPRGIWRRPIDGQKPRTLGPMKGAVLRLWPDEAVTTGLVLGEGVETTLAAATRIIRRGTMLQPAWASGSADNMATFPALAGVEALTLLVDNDASLTGQEAAEVCARRWRTAGREMTRLISPIVGTDLNDIVMNNGDAS
jgi:hypothetical protein